MKLPENSETSMKEFEGDLIWFNENGNLGLWSRGYGGFVDGGRVAGLGVRPSGRFRVACVTRETYEKLCV